MISRTLIIKTLLIILLVLGNHLSQATAQPPACVSNIKTADINGTILHYIECGEGEPLVLVHGSLGDYRTWISQIGAFSKEYRVISYSRRYHYPNPWPQNATDFTANIHAKDLVAFIQALHLDKVHLVGHSYGGLTTLLVAQDKPELIRSLTLGEAAAQSLTVTSSEGKSVFQNFMQHSVRPSHKAFEQGNIEEGVRLFINGVLGEGPYENMPPIAHIFMLENAREMKGQIKGLNDEGIDFFPALTCNDAKQIPVPTLLLDGEVSPRFLGMINDALQRCLPNNKRVLIPEASHDLRIQEPHVFSKKVLPFLDGH